MYNKKIALIIGVLTIACSSIRAQEREAAASCFRPPFLKEGDHVAVIATSYQPTDSSMARSCRVLENWGLRPVIGENIKANPIPKVKDTVKYYSGDAVQRASSLQAALEDDSIKAIVCARGGYGAIQLLKLIPPESFISHPKWIVGYSDVTTIHCAAFSYGVMSIHGEMCNSFGTNKGPDEAALKLRDLLFGDVPVYEIPAHPCNSFGRAEGVLVGGNMITMAALAGTQYDPTSKDGIILFIEEIDESMHAIDRLFNMLIIQNRIPNLRGIVFGDFYECDRDLPFASVEDMLHQYTSKLGIPVCYGFPAGHGKVNMPLIEGARVVLDVNKEGTELSFWL